MIHGNTEVKSFTFNPFSTNSYIVAHQGQALIVDASAYEPSDVEEMVAFVRDRKLVVTRLILTHAHIDHILGCSRLSKAFGLKWELGSRDVELLKMGAQQAAVFGVRLDDPGEPAGYLSDGDSVSVGDNRLIVRDVPGHSPGSIALIDESSGYVLSGDVLFRGSIGRTDLWGADYATLMRSIHQVLLTLDDDVTVYSGHGPETTIGIERSTNPFLTE